MTRAPAIEATLAAWRDAERRLAGAADGETIALRCEVDLYRNDYQRLTAPSMAEWMRRIAEAERRPAYMTLRVDRVTWKETNRWTKQSELRAR